MLRSLLFVPADSERKIAKGLDGDADALILDLGDSVAPDRKAVARETIREVAGNKTLFVRVNPLASEWLKDDLAAALACRPLGIVLPKSNHGHDVATLDALLGAAEAVAGVEEGATRILPIVTETAAGTLATATYADVSNRLWGMTWGAEDLAADVGALAKRHADGRYRDTFRFARVQALLGAVAACVEPVDTVFPDFRDADGFARECEEAATDGFTAKMAIHPMQIEAINAAFTPSEETVAEARAIIEAFVAAGDPGVVALDGRMLDRPHLVAAKRILARMSEG